ncbi:UDP-2,3-diacylglucosamine diphosphatase [Saccharospirillum impatiens]|uniref:UDP-2,3-diacylglucosamine diphosphatase n=1 Tax=Saccharospirillum impatiens TaxID=169438 RepID=UPI00040F5F0F|nr:UDP-2,3-diacylglucosamine diphosphatase [Saccharospirillum impatiens]
MIHHRRAVLISDLHLSEARPDLVRAFSAFLGDVASQTEALFILGDFFEYWVGDDATTPLHDDIARQLNRLSDTTAIYLMVGNRDFALGKRYAERCNATLLSDPTPVQLGTQTWLLSHGDRLCTDDRGYQRYRAVIQSPPILGTLRRLPLAWRLKLAERLRRASKDRNRAGAPRYIDVNQRAVKQRLKGTGFAGLIHGHTHMADWHAVSAEGEPTRERLVMGDWDTVAWYLSFDGDDKTLNRFNVNQLEFELAPR